MNNLESSLPDRVAKICIEAYNNLPKFGKPNESEWTILSCIVQYDDFYEEMRVVSLGTGSKCIGTSGMNRNGYPLNDCHAEIMARRGFLLYLYDNLTRAASGDNTIFRLDDNKFRLDENVSFYFYASQLPCGDACILPMTPEEIEKERIRTKTELDPELPFGDVVQNYKRPGDSDNDEINDAKRQKLDNGDVHRTGAKCLPQCEQDSLVPGIDFHSLGQVRTKPGRGDPTLSVSCSDKMARWVQVGIQGALINMVLHEPIFIKLFVFGSGKTYSKDSLERALLYRNFDRSAVKLECVPEIEQTSLVFTHMKSETRLKLGTTSIVWAKLHKNPLTEVASRGRRLGAVVKCLHYVSSYLSISKHKIYKKFLTFALSIPEPAFKNIFGETEKSSLIDIPYNEMKLRSKSYMDRWESVKTNFFGAWTLKPVIWNFRANSPVKK